MDSAEETHDSKRSSNTNDIADISESKIERQENNNSVPVFNLPIVKNGPRLHQQWIQKDILAASKRKRLSNLIAKIPLHYLDHVYNHLTDYVRKMDCSTEETVTQSLNFTWQSFSNSSTRSPLSNAASSFSHSSVSSSSSSAASLETSSPRLSQMDLLPNTILSKVFTYLRPIRDLMQRCQMVNQVWLKVVSLPTSCTTWTEEIPRKNSRLFNKICIRAPHWFYNVDSIRSNDPSTIFAIHSDYKLLQRADLHLAPRVIKEFVEKFKNVKYLSLNFDSMLSNQNLKIFSCVRELNISHRNALNTTSHFKLDLTEAVCLEHLCIQSNVFQLTPCESVRALKSCSFEAMCDDFHLSDYISNCIALKAKQLDRIVVPDAFYNLVAPLLDNGRVKQNLYKIEFDVKHDNRVVTYSIESSAIVGESIRQDDRFFLKQPLKRLINSNINNTGHTADKKSGPTISNCCSIRLYDLPISAIKQVAARLRKLTPTHFPELKSINFRHTCTHAEATIIKSGNYSHYAHRLPIFSVPKKNKTGPCSDGDHQNGWLHYHKFKTVITQAQFDKENKNNNYYSTTVADSSRAVYQVRVKLAEPFQALVVKNNVEVSFEMIPNEDNHKSAAAATIAGRTSRNRKLKSEEEDHEELRSKLQQCPNFEKYKVKQVDKCVVLKIPYDSQRLQSAHSIASRIIKKLSGSQF